MASASSGGVGLGVAYAVVKPQSDYVFLLPFCDDRDSTVQYAIANTFTHEVLKLPPASEAHRCAIDRYVCPRMSYRNIHHLRVSLSPTGNWYVHMC